MGRDLVLNWVGLLFKARFPHASVAHVLALRCFLVGQWAPRAPSLQEWSRTGVEVLAGVTCKWTQPDALIIITMV